MSALSLSLFGVCAVGCSADVKPDGEALATTSQATSVFTPSGANNLQFSGEFVIGANSSQVIIVGGYNNAGVAQTTAGILNPGAGTWKPFVVSAGSSTLSPLPNARGEMEIQQVAANKYMVAGGRTARAGGSVVASTYILTLSGTSGNIAVWTPVTTGLATARVIGTGNLQKCGAGKVIAIGGSTGASAMIVTAGAAATNSIEVFTFNSGTPASSTWSTLKLGSDTSKTVQLATARGYHRVLHVSDTKFKILGGANGTTGTALATAESLEVNSGGATDCTAIDASVQTPGGASPRSLVQGTSMPQARARGASIAQSGSYTLGGSTFNYDFVIASGNNASGFTATPPTAIFFYNSTSDIYDDTKASLNVGRVFGRFANDGGPVKMATGVVPNTTSGLLLNNTTASVDSISTAGAVTGLTALTNSRVGSTVQSLNNVEYAAFGTNYTGGNAGTAQTDVESF